MTTSSLKSKKTTDRETNCDLPDNKQRKISLSSSKLIKKLSLSFYGEETIRHHKQVICDNCDLTSFLSLPRKKSKSKQHKIPRITNIGKTEFFGKPNTPLREKSKLRKERSKPREEEMFLEKCRTVRGVGQRRELFNSKKR